MQKIKKLLKAISNTETLTEAFATVAKHLPARTEASCSSRYYTLRTGGQIPEADVLRNRRGIMTHNEVTAAEIIDVTSDEQEFLLPVSLRSIKTLIDQLSPEQRSELISHYIS